MFLLLTHYNIRINFNYFIRSKRCKPNETINKFEFLVSDLGSLVGKATGTCSQDSQVQALSEVFHCISCLLRQNEIYTNFFRHTHTTAPPVYFQGRQLSTPSHHCEITSLHMLVHNNSKKNMNYSLHPQVSSIL